MIGAVHEALRSMVYGDGKIPPGEIDVSFAVPTRDWSSGITRPTINFYLYDISENVRLRESEFERQRTDLREALRLRPRRVDLKYVVTAHFRSPLPDDGDQEWQVLWRVLATLMRNSEWPDALLPDEARRLDTPIHSQVAAPEGAPRPGELWSTLGTPPRPSLHYVLTVPLDLNIEYLRTLVVEVGVGVRDMDSGAVLATSRRYGWTLRGRDGEGLPGAEVRLPDLPGYSVSGENGVFTTTAPHAEVTQMLVRPAGERDWTLVNIKAGSLDVRLP